jgi:hypothetical protein
VPQLNSKSDHNKRSTRARAYPGQRPHFVGRTGTRAYRLRGCLLQLLAALLLLQWVGFPTRALALSALQVGIDTSICVPGGATQKHPVAPDRGAPWADQIYVVAHALDQTALLPPSTLVPVAIRWVPTTAPLVLPTEGPAAPRAPPLQPRAPPSLT